MTTSKAYNPDVVTLSPNIPVDQVVTPEFLTIQAGTTISGDPELVLKADVYVSIECSKDGVLIRSVLFDEEGYGRTYEEAWDDFLSSLRDRRDSLAKREARLSPLEGGILKELRSVIAP